MSVGYQLSITMTIQYHYDYDNEYN